MNSLKNIRSTFATKIIDVISQYNAETSGSVEVAFENGKAEDFDNYFVTCSLIPALNEHHGKKSTDKDSDEGIYQVSIYGPRANGKYTITHFELCDYIKEKFRESSPLNGIDIVNVNANGGRDVDAWFVVDLSINWFVISN